MGLLANLGGPEAMGELHRWLTREDATPSARAIAAMVLARVHDRPSIPAIIRLLDPPDPVRAGHDNGRVHTIEALRLRPAPESTGALYATLLRQGPKAEGSYSGLMALASFATAEAKEDIGRLSGVWGSDFPMHNLDWVRENSLHAPGLSPDVVQQVLAERSRAIRHRCWDHFAGGHTAATETVHVTIDPSGRVTSARSAGDSVRLGACLEVEVSQWYFPQSAGATDTDLPFKFSDD
jgi:hypothetical protein